MLYTNKTVRISKMTAGYDRFLNDLQDHYAPSVTGDDYYGYYELSGPKQWIDAVMDIAKRDYGVDYDESEEVEVDVQDELDVLFVKETICIAEGDDQKLRDLIVQYGKEHGHTEAEILSLLG